MNWNQKQLENFLARPYISKSLATNKKKIGLFHQKSKTSFENLMPSTLFSFSLKKKRAATSKNNKKIWNLSFRYAVSKIRFKRRQSFLKNRVLLLSHSQGKVTKLPLSLTKIRKISRFFLKQANSLFAKKKSKLLVFSKFRKKKKRSVFFKKKKLFTKPKKTAFWRIKTWRFKAIKRLYKKKIYRLRKKRKNWEKPKTFLKKKRIPRHFKRTWKKRKWKAMVPHRKKRYHFFRNKRRPFFREHRRIRRHPYGYLGMAHFFSKEKDYFQLHKANRFFFQQNLAANIYQNWAKNFDKKKLPPNYKWFCSNLQTPLLFQKKERVFRRCFFFNNQDNLQNKAHRHLLLQNKKRVVLKKNLEISQRIKKTLLLPLILKKQHLVFNNKRKQMNLISIKKKKIVLTPTTKNIKSPLLFGNYKILFSNSLFSFSRKVSCPFYKQVSQLSSTRTFSSLAWKFVEKRKTIKIKKAKKKKLNNLSSKSATNRAVKSKQKRNFFFKPSFLLKKKRFNSRFVKFRLRGSRTIIKQVKARRKKKLLTFNQIARKKKLRFRRRGHRNWFFRFPRWKTYYRNLWRYGHSNQKARWIRSELYSYRLYRQKHQIYRIKNPRKTKNNKWLLRLETSFKRHRIRTRYKRLVSRLMHFKLFSKFYGPFTWKKISHWSKHFQKINPKKTSRKVMALTWFDRRLDITVYRLGLAPSLKVAQILVKKGYIFVNGQQIINYQKHLNLWDVVSITPYMALTFYYFWYWLVRNQYKRHAFKTKAKRHKALSSNRLTYSFGFWLNTSKERNLPRTDRIQAKEFERLLLSKYFI